MTKKPSLFLRIGAAGLLLALAACRSSTDRSEGAVLLSVSDFDELPVAVSVSQAGGIAQIGEVTVSNVAKDPTGATSSLMDVEIRSYEVTFRRLDNGSRQIPPFTERLFGNVPVNGETDFDNLPFMRTNQLLTPPLSDLASRGSDSETGSQVIPVNVTLRFFGRTLSGDDIVSTPATFTIEVVP